jgi:hypothetical protein
MQVQANAAFQSGCASAQAARTAEARSGETVCVRWWRAGQQHLRVAVVCGAAIQHEEVAAAKAADRTLYLQGIAIPAAYLMPGVRSVSHGAIFAIN